jgi:putative redox protein
MPHIISSFEKKLFQIGLKSDSGNILIADEPLSKGGGDTGFAPQELLAASLAACTGATLRMYAIHKEWDLQDAEVHVTLDWDPETNTTAINRSIKLTGNLDEKQLERLMRVAEACPVHKIISHPINIVTTAG